MASRDPIQRKADLQVRIKRLTANLTAYAYAAMGASFVDPYLKGAGFKTASSVGLALALVLHAVAWYAAPYGEKT